MSESEEEVLTNLAKLVQAGLKARFNEEYDEAYQEIGKALDGKLLPTVVGVLFSHALVVYQRYRDHEEVGPRFRELFHGALEKLIQETAHRPLVSVNPLTV